MNMTKSMNMEVTMDMDINMEMETETDKDMDRTKIWTRTNRTNILKQIKVNINFFLNSTSF